MKKAFKCVLPSVTNQLLILARADLASGCRAARLKQVGVRVGHESTRPRITLPRFSEKNLHSYFLLYPMHRLLLPVLCCIPRIQGGEKKYIIMKQRRKLHPDHMPVRVSRTRPLWMVPTARGLCQG